MKILFINKFFFLNGGSEVVFFQERNFCNNNGISIMDFSMHDERNFPSIYSDYFIPNIDYKSKIGFFSNISKSIAFIHNKKAIKNLASLLDHEKPDIAHLHNIYHQLTPAIIPFLKEKGIKTILTLHDCKLVCPSYLMLNNNRICDECCGNRFYKAVTNKCQGSFLNGLLLAMESYWHMWRKSYEKVDMFISPSKFLSNLVEKYRIPSDKLHILKNGIDISDFYACDEDKGYILYFGRLSYEKGVETLLQAHSKIADKMPLKIVGTGPLEDMLRMRYSNAEFLGYKSGQELKTLICNSSFVVIPSECHENCSIAILEAMAMSKPVIGSKLGGIPEQIDDFKTGLLFDAGNTVELTRKMIYLADNPDIRKIMGKAARQKVQKEYSLDNHCQQLMRVYQQLMRI